jgi:hypothetical protein
MGINKQPFLGNGLVNMLLYNEDPRPAEVIIEKR